MKQNNETFSFNVSATDENRIYLFKATFEKINNVTTPKGIIGGTAVICTITSKDIYPYTGVAVCNPKDKFDPIIGIKKSLARTLKQFPNNNKHVRKLFWFALKYELMRGGLKL